MSFKSQIHHWLGDEVLSPFFLSFLIYKIRIIGRSILFNRFEVKWDDVCYVFGALWTVSAPQMLVNTLTSRLWKDTSCSQRVNRTMNPKVLRNSVITWPWKSVPNVSLPFSVLVKLFLSLNTYGLIEFPLLKLTFFFLYLSCYFWSLVTVFLNRFEFLRIKFYDYPDFLTPSQKQNLK